MSINKRTLMVQTESAGLLGVDEPALRAMVERAFASELRKRLDEAAESIMKEVRYVDNSYDYRAGKYSDEEPLRNDQTLRVFHGFDNLSDAVTVAMYGTSGKMRARRKYSYETGMNPIGLFVTVDFDKAADFANGKTQVVMEFSAKVSDLDFPVWNGSDTYFGQGSDPRPFRDRADREKQRKAYQDTAAASGEDRITKSDNPALARSIFANDEHQALFVGDLGPNQIKRFWTRETAQGPRWTKHTREEFLKKFQSHELSPQASERAMFPEDKLYRPNEDYQGFDDLLRRAAEDWNAFASNPKFHKTPEQLRSRYEEIFNAKRPDLHSIQVMLWPRQIIQMFGQDFYRQYVDRLGTLKNN